MLILHDFAVVSLLSLFLAHWFLKVTPGTKLLDCKEVSVKCIAESLNLFPGQNVMIILM